MAEARAAKFCTQVGFIKSYQKNKKSPPKGAWLWSHDLFKFLAPLDISGMAKTRDFKFCTLVRQVAI